MKESTTKILIETFDEVLGQIADARSSVFRAQQDLVLMAYCQESIPTMTAKQHEQLSTYIIEIQNALEKATGIVTGIQHSIAPAPPISTHKLPPETL